MIVILLRTRSAMFLLNMWPKIGKNKKRRNISERFQPWIRARMFTRYDTYDCTLH